jgi:hypothetical protein
MLQVLHLDVSKVDRVLHLSHRFLLPRFGVSSSPSVALNPYEGDAARAGEGGALGAGGRDVPRDCSVDGAHIVPFRYTGRYRFGPFSFIFYAGY